MTEGVGAEDQEVRGRAWHRRIARDGVGGRETVRRQSEEGKQLGAGGGAPVDLSPEKNPTKTLGFLGCCNDPPAESGQLFGGV